MPELEPTTKTENLQELYGWVDNADLLERYRLGLEITTQTIIRRGNSFTTTRLDVDPYSVVLQTIKYQKGGTFNYSLTIAESFLDLGRERQALVLANCLKVADTRDLKLTYRFDPDLNNLIRQDAKQKVEDFIEGNVGSFYSQVLEKVKKEQ